MKFELTLHDLRQLINNDNSIKKGDNPITFWEIGQKYFIRTVTMIQIGRLIEFSDNELVLEDASWIAETERFYDSLKDGSLREVEPFINKCLVNRQSIIDATIWEHELPRDQK